jgi:hypothetical protein
MENLNQQDVAELAQTIYQPDTKVEEINSELALEIGRQLTEQRYRMIGACVISAGSGDSVASLLGQIDRSGIYKRQVETNPDVFIGPYYIQLPKSEFCPSGIGVWQTNQD